MSTGSAIRYEAALKVTGRAVFPGEVPADDALHGALVQATSACADVVTVDGTAARQVAGFADLISYADVQDLRPSSVTQLIREPRIHFAGQPVALVVATSPVAARAAARAVHVEQSGRPAITTMHDALEHAYVPAMASRITPTSRRGDPEQALAAAAVVVERRYTTSVNNHHPMEPHSVVCAWDDDRVTVHTSTQAVFATRAAIAHAFGIDQDSIRVTSEHLGGGFGCKGQLWWPWMLLALCAARRTGRPVRLELTRAQMFALVGRRQETQQDLAVGAAADGRLTAIRHDVLTQTSTHAEFCDSTAGVSRWLYACPNVATGHQVVRTNEPQPIPMRAPGTAPGTFALESVLDEVADLLSIDPVELRIRNVADHDQDAGLPWTSNGLLECYRVGAERFGWERRPPRGSVTDGRWRIGSGMASTCYPARRQACRVRMRLAADGELLVQCGTQDMGSGTYTALAQLAAAALEIPIGRVRVELGDTLLPLGPMSAGSQVTASIAPALLAAAEQLSANLAAARAAGRTGTVEAEGESPAGSEESYIGMGHGAVFVDVGVDEQLGEVRVRRVTAAFAAGRIVNPLLAHSQYVGGLIGGIGMALHERTTTDVATGRIIGDNLADYLIPVHADMPEFDIAMIDQHDPHLPGGIKGVGMLGTAGIQAAIANAVFDATGRRVRHLPIRIEDLLDGSRGRPD